MGLAASQVRLLQLTSRQHKIEYQAQMIQAQKLQLANESDKVYNNYMQALDAKKVQYKYIESDGSISYKDATFNSMFGGYNNSTHEGVQELYALNNVKTGAIVLSSTIYSNYNTVKTSSTSTKDAFILKFTTETDINKVDQAIKDYYGNLWDLIKSNNGNVIKMERETEFGDDYTWLTNVLANGDYYLSKWNTEAGDDGKGAWTEVSVSTDTLLQEVADEKELKKAEAIYEAENTKINRKDAQYDTLLSQTETERNAIKTEIDSLKQVRNDNIDKAFKLFS